jgi:hypothetical protein
MSDCHYTDKGPSHVALVSLNTYDWSLSDVNGFAVLLERSDQGYEDLVNAKGYHTDPISSRHGYPLISCTIYIVIKP